MNKKIVLGSVGLLLIALATFLLLNNPIVDLVIVHTNDHHGYCWADKNQGGFAKQMTLLKKIRKENKNVLLLSGGDINSGSPESDLNNAEPSFRGMNLLRFDAMVLGNHEFDVSVLLSRKQQEWSNFPFISTNIYDNVTQKTFANPYVIKKIGGLKIALLGLTTLDTPRIAGHSDVTGLTFKDPISEAQKIISELKNKVDVFIALSHLGYYPNEQEDKERSGDLSLARGNPELTVIVGGHTHTVLEKPVQVGKTLILQAGDYAKNMGELHLKINKQTKEVLESEYILHPLDEKIPEDPKMIAFLLPYLEKAQKLTLEPIGEAQIDLDGEREHVRVQETNLGNLVTDVFRHVAAADIALQNGGGIRASINKGQVTYGDVLKAFPFPNTIVLFKLKGSEIIEILNKAASLPRPAGGFLHVSGAKVVIEKNRVKKISVGNGTIINPEKIYTVATNSFVAQGGDGYDMLKDKPKMDTGFTIASALKRYIAEKKTLAPKVEGRIVIK